MKHVGGSRKAENERWVFLGTPVNPGCLRYGSAASPPSPARQPRETGEERGSSLGSARLRKSSPCRTAGSHPLRLLLQPR